MAVATEQLKFQSTLLVTVFVVVVVVNTHTLKGNSNLTALWQIFL